ncbi:D-alanyl-D-alanine carboxypeptidase / D-alanyl-D-alanine-endopeptidase (penicillin-binding protein 4) [Roseovarius lutimaris]|uniref:D-alanyl-D-alanine carboxypeptidase / D-alanyl-D-alanine-endopeptidase (Penicillin-binding protein 4) n=1 Tax=Roseovarius lutimaris TaxID=1005928 RepID=A0A1I5DTS8_9RHOB|nr:D-alanyl-D-alanine carboxypeptidase/D-alanyl-D-alanine-endopeptidase [Roseovarius lutimaris]SFO02596.1 D-alanyl-D-alanine carboxypeptidase / D-alanyl-D-alanine-endopeptidase (penicillin-binding protein 4) [Roseovarius lutimaris]
MSKGFSRRAFLGTALSALAVPAWAGAPSVSLRPQARPGDFARTVATRGPSAPSTRALIAEAKLSGRVGFAVSDAKTGLVLEQGDGALGLPPASVTKAVTALYGLETLGANHRFQTRLIATGPISNGILQGDLILAGGGDPTLDTNALAGMAAALKKKGLREVRGKFLVWGGAVPFLRAIDETQPEHAGYNPSLSGLNLNYNRVHFEWKRSGGNYAITMDARSDKYRPDVTMARMRIAERTSPVYTYRATGARDDWTVARRALGNGGARWLPVRQPELYAGEVFATFARAQGLKLGKPGITKSTPSGTTLVTHQSDTLSKILRGMLRYSTNLTAEMIGLAASAARLGKPVNLRASAREMTAWAKSSLGMSSAKLVDHSGLGDASRLTASSMAGALGRAHRAGLLKPLLRDIPLRDTRGRALKSQPVKVVAKTGTLYFVSALAGYMTTPDGAEMAFAIFTASDSLRAKVNSAQDERPPGAASWNRRAKKLQQALIERWGTVYGG